MTLSKFRLLFWKNFILAKRHPISTLLEIIFPIIVVSLFTLVKNATKPEELRENTYEEFRLENCLFYDEIDRIVIAPISNPELTDLIKQTEFYKTFKENNVEILFLQPPSRKEQFMEDKTLIIKFSKVNSVSIAIFIF